MSSAGILNAARNFWSEFLVARLGPFFVVMLATGLTSIGLDSKHGWILFLIAGVLIAWALDMTYERGRNKVGADYALSIATLLREGSAEIIISQKHTYYADEATREAIDSLKAVHESAVPKGDLPKDGLS